MDTANKSNSMQFQTQVRHNADSLRGAIRDLYSWEKDIKKNEAEMLNERNKEAEPDSHTMPVRSHVIAQDAHKLQEQKQNGAVVKNANGTPAKEAKTSTEKCEKPLSANEEKRQQANLVKNMGNKFVKVGEFDKALLLYNQAIEIYPEDAIFYSNRALCYLKLEEYDLCIEDCDRAVEIDCLNVKAHYRRMQANESLGNNIDALKDCTTVLMIEPKNSEAQRSLDRINDRLKKLKSTSGPNFSALRDNMIDILPYDKPSYKRSNAPLHRVNISDVVVPNQIEPIDNFNVSDEVIDNLFNSSCGPFVEIKEKPEPKTTPVPVPRAIIKPNKNTIAMQQQNITNVRKASSTVDTNKVPPTQPKVSKETVGDQPLLLSKGAMPPPAASTAQFYATWKQLTPERKYQYLKSIEMSNLCKALGASLDSETLMNIINIIRDYYVTNKDLTTAATLLEISKNSEIGLLSMFFAPEEHKVLLEILNYIKEDKSNTATAELIAHNFNIS